MKQLSLTEIQQIELNILQKFKAFCDSNDITYYLSNGSLLGAVKYKGFIPWDDDIDVLVPREDYDRLVRIFKDDERFCLFSYERNHKFRFPFAKLCDMSTLKIEQNTDNGIALGLDIDIFPLDNWADDIYDAKSESAKILRLIHQLDFVKLKKADCINSAKRFVKSIVMFIYKRIGSSFFVKRIIKQSRNNIMNKSSYCGCKSWPIYGEHEIIPSELFEGTTVVEFEGEKFTAPIGYDKYLRSLYGDYEHDPPESEQKTHHHFKAYQNQ